MLERENVYVDVDDLSFVRLFPTKAGFGPKEDARLDTLEEETAKLSFALSEPADSVLITYHGYDVMTKVRCGHGDSLGRS